MARRLVVEIVGDSSSLQRSLVSASGATASFGSRMKSVGSTLSRDVTLPIVGIGAIATDSAMKFQRSMELIHTQAGVSQEAIASLSKAVVGMARSVATGPETLSTGLFHLASQGLRGKQALDALRIAAEGAKVGQANLEDVTNALGASIVSGIKGAGNYTEAMGILNSTVGAGDMHMQDLADAMGTGLPAKAALAGVSLRDVGAALAVFGDNNIRGAKAGTDLASAIRLMAAPSKAAAKELATVGLSATQLADDMRSKGLVAAVEDLKTHMHDAGLSADETNLLIARAFGGKQATGVSILIDQLDRLKKKTADVGAGASSFGSAWQATTQTTAFKFDQMKAALESAGIAIGGALLPLVTKLADGLSGLSSAFSSLSPGVRDAILVFAGVLAAAGPLAFVIGSISTVIEGLTAAAGGLSAAMGFLAANPVVAVSLALVALGVALYEAWQHSATFRRIVTDAFNAVEDAARAVAKFVTQTIPKAFEDVLHWVSAHWPEIATLIAGPFAPLVALATNAFGVRDALTGAFDVMYRAVTRVMGDVVTFMEHVPGQIVSALGDLSDLLVNAGASIIHGLIHGMTSAFGDVKKALGWLTHVLPSWKGPLETDSTILFSSGQTVIQGFLDGLQSRYADVQSSLAGLTGSIQSGLDPAIAAAMAKLKAPGIWRQTPQGGAGDGGLGFFDPQSQQSTMNHWLAAQNSALNVAGNQLVMYQARASGILAEMTASWRASGIALGDALAQGIIASIPLVVAATEQLADAVSKYLPHSPAEKGPLSKPIGWGSYIMGNLAGSAAAASAALSSGLSAPSPAYAGGAGGGGGGGGNVQVTVNVPQGFVGSPQELVDALTQAFVRAGNSGHPYWKNLNRLA